eukprot:1750242-Prymnesium_polylepis.1
MQYGATALEGRERRRLPVKLRRSERSRLPPPPRYAYPLRRRFLAAAHPEQRAGRTGIGAGRPRRRLVVDHLVAAARRGGLERGQLVRQQPAQLA